MLTDSIKRACEIRKFHVAVMQQRLRNVQKSVMQSCSFANLNLLLFHCSPSPLQKLPAVVIQKFCYHGNVMSDFSSLLCPNWMPHKQPLTWIQFKLLFKCKPFPPSTPLRQITCCRSLHCLQSVDCKQLFQFQESLCRGMKSHPTNLLRKGEKVRCPSSTRK